MRKPKPADALFWVVAALAAASFTLFVLVLAGVVPVGSSDPSVEDAAPVAAPARPSPEPEAKPEAKPEAEPVVDAPAAKTDTVKEPAQRLVTVVVTATRGDCWLAARAGSETGRLLEERILLQGETVRLRAARVWLSLGAASNVDVLVDQEPHEVPAGTVALVLTPSSRS